jgi:superfamily II DNA or RNA helicase
MIELRPWQQTARNLIAKSLSLPPSDNNTILIEAGIGSGKTLAALISAKDAYDSKRIGRIIVVTFTSHLVRQWGKVATAVGLNLLECRGGNGVLKEGFPVDAQGYITTFASVSAFSAMHESHATGLKAIIILDEIHHLGEDYDSKSTDSDMTEWAKENYSAFKNAHMILALSGTPYRTDKKRIPFVQYEPKPDENDLYKLISDVQYSYGQSVYDEICRRVVFDSLDGPIDMTVNFEKNGTVVKKHTEIIRFEDKIDPERYYDRLAAALKIDSEYNPSKSKNQLVVDLIRKANNRLHDLRLTDPRAGGLVIANDKDAARKLKTMIRQVTGHDAILILEDIDKTSDLISAFEKGDSPWIIAVNMVAEGVDIPRLRVCIYLSTKTAWLYVMQVIGRIVRSPPGQSYFFFLPDPRLVKITKKIEELLEIWLRKKKPGPAPPAPEFKKFIDLNNAAGDKWSGMVAGEPATAAEMEQVDEMRRTMPDLNDADYLVLLQMARKTKASREQNAKTAKPQSDDMGMSYTDIRLDLRAKIQKRVGKLHILRPDRPANDIHTDLNKAIGVRGKNSASREQLEHMLALIDEWIALAERNEDGDPDEC